MRIYLFETYLAYSLVFVALLRPTTSSIMPSDGALDPGASSYNHGLRGRAEKSPAAIQRRGIRFSKPAPSSASSYATASSGSSRSRDWTSAEVVTLPRRIDHEPRREEPEYVWPSPGNGSFKH